MSDESPLCGAEEWMDFNVGGASSCAQSSVLVLDKQLPNQGLAKTVRLLAWLKVAQSMYEIALIAYFEICGAPAWSGKGMSSRRMLANVALRFLPLKGVVP